MGVGRGGTPVARYTVYVTPDALHEIKELPGNVRQRVRRAIADLADNPHPRQSKTLQVPDIEATVCRIRLNRWRIIYAVSDADAAIDVLGIRKRPPYDYGDLDELLSDISPGHE